MNLVSADTCFPLHRSSAVVNEALRIHPPTGFILERVVPTGGVVLSGRFIPAGTVVGVNAWVLHRNQQVFGPDVETFRPERWLEGENESNSSAKIAERQRNLVAVCSTPSLCVTFDPYIPTSIYP